jgi:uncharacterized protein
VHSVTKARLAEAAKGFAPHAEPLPIPASPSYSAAKVRRPAFRPRLLQRSKLAALARGAEGSLLVTPSRRTRADSLAALSAAIKDVPHIRHGQVQALKGRSRQLARFHALMQERGATRPFEGRLETWTYAPINDTELVASAIRRALHLETKA